VFFCPASIRGWLKLTRTSTGPAREVQAYNIDSEATNQLPIPSFLMAFSFRVCPLQSMERRFPPGLVWRA
jgi:hypothetical protein